MHRKTDWREGRGRSCASEQQGSAHCRCGYAPAAVALSGRLASCRAHALSSCGCCRHWCDARVGLAQTDLVTPRPCTRMQLGTAHRGTASVKPVPCRFGLVWTDGFRRWLPGARIAAGGPWSTVAWHATSMVSPKGAPSGRSAVSATTWSQEATRCTVTLEDLLLADSACRLGRVHACSYVLREAYD